MVSSNRRSVQQEISYTEIENQIILLFTYAFVFDNRALFVRNYISFEHLVLLLVITLKGGRYGHLCIYDSMNIDYTSVSITN